MSTDFSSSLKNFSIDSPQMRRAGRELLSLALMDARNHSLFLYSLFEKAQAEKGRSRAGACPGLHPPLWQLGHVGWFQEYWVGRNLQRRGGRHRRRGDAAGVD